jgi:hypothetical protein
VPEALQYAKYDWAAKCTKRLAIFDDEAKNSVLVLRESTVVAGKHHLNMKLAHVPAVREEAFATTEAERTRVEYKMAYSARSGRTRLFTWADASMYLHGSTYTLEKDESKAADKILKTAKVPAGDLETGVRALEQ